MTHVMLDIETLGTKPGSAVLSIGAVAFNEDGLLDDTEHYSVVSTDSLVKAGLVADINTVMWWLHQNKEAQEAIVASTNDVPLYTALSEFNNYLNNVKVHTVWANAPTFDCALMRAAYEAVNLKPGWSFRDERCFRTLMELAPQERENVGTHHNALDDAKAQAVSAAKALKELSKK